LAHDLTGPVFESFTMALMSPAARQTLRALVAAGLFAAPMLFGSPVLAASNRAFQGVHSQNDDAGTGNNFNLDQDPCLGRNGRNRGASGGEGACPEFGGGYSAHGNGAARHPGSNAFGLQFNSGDD
jgi:hypothetical protein